MRVIAEKEDNPYIPKAKVSCTGQGYSTKGCGRLLEITPIDVENQTYQSWGETERAFYVCCPICKVRTEVYPRNFQEDFWRLVHK